MTPLGNFRRWKLMRKLPPSKLVTSDLVHLNLILCGRAANYVTGQILWNALKSGFEKIVTIEWTRCLSSMAPLPVSFFRSRLLCVAQASKAVCWLEVLFNFFLVWSPLNFVESWHLRQALCSCQQTALIKKPLSVFVLMHSMLSCYLQIVVVKICQQFQRYIMPSLCWCVYILYHVLTFLLMLRM